jgi:hypothetical protein
VWNFVEETADPSSGTFATSCKNHPLVITSGSGGFDCAFALEKTKKKNRKAEAMQMVRVEIVFIRNPPDSRNNFESDF